MKFADLKTCNKMKELGFPQDSEFSYFENRASGEAFIDTGGESWHKEICSAPSLDEVLDKTTEGDNNLTQAACELWLKEKE